MNRIILFFKKEAILCISFILAVVSCFIVIPSKEYISYIDFHTLLLLFSLMAVMQGFRNARLFDSFAITLLKSTKNTRQISALMIFLCFFTSMLITNDVALITFVPLALEVFTKANKKGYIPITVVMQTIAANLGSMLTPVGNPQNLYLYSVSGMSFTDMISIMLPYWCISGLLILISLLFVPKDNNIFSDYSSNLNLHKKSVMIYTCLFIICMLSVAHIISVSVATSICVIAVLLYDRSIFKSVDYSLLITFVCFFIFIGNIGNIESVNSFINSVLTGNEIAVSVISSQFISNVPAALLLSGFSNKYELLMVGTNIGGLGTIIASMASLISYKQIEENKGRYFILFTLFNIVFLLILLLATIIFK